MFIDDVVTSSTRYSPTTSNTATDHVDLLKGKLDQDKDAIVDTKPDKVVDKDVDDDLATMMSGLGIETKCSICFTMYLFPRLQISNIVSPQAANAVNHATQISKQSK